MSILGRRTGDEAADSFQSQVAADVNRISAQPTSRGMAGFKASSVATSGQIAPDVTVVRYTGKGGHTLTLPKASALGGGVAQLLIIRHAGTGSLTVAAPGTDRVNAATSIALTAGYMAFLASDGNTAWGGIVSQSIPSAFNINGLTAETVTDIANDYVPMYDASAAADRKVTVGNLLNISALTAITDASPFDDAVPLYDSSASGNRKALLRNLISDPGKFSLIDEEFLGTTFRGGLVVAGDGIPVAANQAGSANRPGIVRISGGSNYQAVASGVNSVRLGGGRVHFRADINASSYSGKEVTAGLVSTITTNPPVNGVFFMASSANSGNWQCLCYDDSNVTTINTSVAATGGSWYALEFEVNAGGTSVEFFINGTSVGTTTTNIPTASGREIGVLAGRSAVFIPPTIDIDVCRVLFEYTTER